MRRTYRRRRRRRYGGKGRGNYQVANTVMTRGRKRSAMQAFGQAAVPLIGLAAAGAGAAYAGGALVTRSVMTGMADVAF